MDEQQEQIRKAFEASWDKTLGFYESLMRSYPNFGFLKPVTAFITDLKSRGENSHFRLGTSVYSLIISRSAGHGLREGQKYIRIIAKENSFDITLYNGSESPEAYTLPSLTRERVGTLLETLKHTPVD